MIDAAITTAIRLKMGIACGTAEPRISIAKKTEEKPRGPNQEAAASSLAVRWLPLSEGQREREEGEHLPSAFAEGQPGLNLDQGSNSR